MNLSFSRTLRRVFFRRKPATPDSRPDVYERPFALDEAALTGVLGIQPREIALYERALMHRSMLRGRPDSHLFSNERLEFLGDAVLGLVVAEHIWVAFPEEDEGFLTRLRSKLVNGQALARVALAIRLGTLILISDNMEQTGGRENATILADAYEAVVGALYLDHGLPEARRFIRRTLLDRVDLIQVAERTDNYKSLLLEKVQARQWAQPAYRLVAEQGPSHERIFTVEVVLCGSAYGTGVANSKKKAEQKAAHEALIRLKEEDAGSLSGDATRSAEAPEIPSSTGTVRPGDAPEQTS